MLRRSGGIGASNYGVASLLLYNVVGELSQSLYPNDELHPNAGRVREAPVGPYQLASPPLLKSLLATGLGHDAINQI
jgi:hypothetical protein